VEVREYILSLRQRGFNIKLVTFDRWESHEMMEYLKGIGIKSDGLSVAKRHYEDMALAIQENRVVGPKTPTKDGNLVAEELLQLRIMPNDKIDHPRKGSKDLADSVCGAIYNAVAHTPRENNSSVIEIQTLTSFNQRVDNVQQVDSRRGQIIQPPKREMPDDLGSYLRGLDVI
jgi:hypothetical protein